MDHDDMMCFICFDNNKPIRTLECKCKNMYCHDACLLEWLNQKPNQCSICKYPYGNIRTTYKRKTIWKYTLCIVLCIWLAICGCAVISSFELATLDCYRNPRLFLYFTFVTSILYVGIVCTLPIVNKAFGLYVTDFKVAHFMKTSKSRKSSINEKKIDESHLIVPVEIDRV